MDNTPAVINAAALQILLKKGGFFYLINPQTSAKPPTFANPYPYFTRKLCNFVIMYLCRAKSLAITVSYYYNFYCNKVIEITKIV